MTRVIFYDIYKSTVRNKSGEFEGGTSTLKKKNLRTPRCGRAEVFMFTGTVTMPTSLVQEKSSLYFQNDLLSIFNEDVLKIKDIKDESIDLMITSPPYNLDIKYNSHDDKMDYSTYLSFTKDWLSRCYGFAKDDGRFCLNIPLDKNKGGQQSVCADITSIAKEVGWKYHSTIIWNEGNISRRTAWGSWLSASAPYVALSTK